MNSWQKNNKDPFSLAREWMVRDQIEARGIKDKRLLKVMRKIPRHLFVDEALRDQAYNDYPLPIGEGQTISQPYIVALMTEALELKGQEKVLEIGTGSGYQTAILAELAQSVFTIERVPTLMQRAKAILDSLGYFNVAYKTGNGTLGWPEVAPFQGIIVTAAAPEIPQPYVEQLDIGGKLVIPLGDKFSQVLYKIIKLPDGRIKKEYLCGCRFVPLVGIYGWSE
ncbi:Protein-L-isoaspartate(D-aspartate) O-methyltransferase [Candidatus Desulfofervidus auxilii]|uniref:Protein-L-isoaspartate O-methyltransferase n=1 Tax=Desulfofervidus auxilii TaxID=1621989 RepID=A0A7U4THW0_DESA2|nr:protein-L-isoaspartate(D-aspartate) O-methyltransferase [Candidatus Desulfofervidus auxilii]AMM40623.1 Protein-L-isoaspartate(D-aspartate) O-methyltransferase [Candidatus Desulfofervidus auxilii]